VDLKTTRKWVYVRDKTNYRASTKPQFIMDEDSKSLKPLFFDGDKGKFTEWQARFMSYAFL
jgi:hypothetical protein